MEGLGVGIAAISADDRGKSESFRKELGYSLDLLCDIDRAVIKQYHLLNSAEHGGIAYPAIFVIKNNGLIGYRSLDRTANRVNLSEVISYLQNLEQNPEATLRSETPKQFIIPSPKELLQFGRNMLFRGKTDDWKHHLSVPFATIRQLFRRR